MITYTQTNVLLPEWILKQQSSLSEQKFLSIVREYLTRYPNYQFVSVNNGFAVCNREDEVKNKKIKRGNKRGKQ
jgi:siderophore synthetase component